MIGLCDSIGRYGECIPKPERPHSRETLALHLGLGPVLEGRRSREREGGRQGAHDRAIGGLWGERILYIPLTQETIWDYVRLIFLPKNRLDFPPAPAPQQSLLDRFSKNYDRESPAAAASVSEIRRTLSTMMTSRPAFAWICTCTYND